MIYIPDMNCSIKSSLFLRYNDASWSVARFQLNYIIWKRNMLDRITNHNKSSERLHKNYSKKY